MEHLIDVYTKLFTAQHKWFNIGLCLEADYETLRSIEAQYTTFEDQLREMLVHVLRYSSSTTWGELCHCLRNVTVGYNVIAVDIEQSIKGNHNLQ